MAQVFINTIKQILSRTEGTEYPKWVTNLVTMDLFVKNEFLSIKYLKTQIFSYLKETSMTNLCLNLPITCKPHAKHGAKSIVAEVQFMLLNRTCNPKFCPNEISKPNLYKHVDKLNLGTYKCYICYIWFC
jgi:hypothetical protein